MGRPPTLKVLPKNPINARIARLFDASGLSQAAFAKRCGVSGAAVWRWLSDERAPAIAAVPAIAQALGASVEFLLTGEEGIEAKAVARAARAEAERRSWEAEAMRLRAELERLHAEFGRALTAPAASKAAKRRP